MGLPVVSSVHAGIPEAIIHEQTGLLTQERDWEAIAQSILTLLQNEQLRNRFAVAGHSCVELKFNLKANTIKLEEIYNSILDQSLTL